MIITLQQHSALLSSAPTVSRDRNTGQCINCRGGWQRKSSSLANCRRRIDHQGQLLLLCSSAFLISNKFLSFILAATATSKQGAICYNSNPTVKSWQVIITLCQHFFKISWCLTPTTFWNSVWLITAPMRHIIVPFNHKSQIIWQFWGFSYIVHIL